MTTHQKQSKENGSRQTTHHRQEKWKLTTHHRQKKVTIDNTS